MNAVIQTDELDQLAASALVQPALRFDPAAHDADKPWESFLRSDPSASDADKYWKYLFSLSSQTWAVGEAFAHFEHFLQTPPGGETFLDSADDTFEDDDNLISAAAVLEDERRTCTQEPCESPFDQFFPSRDLIIDACTSPRPPAVAVKPRKRLRQLKTQQPPSGHSIRFDDQRFRRSTVTNGAGTPSAPPVPCERLDWCDT